MGGRSETAGARATDGQPGDLHWEACEAWEAADADAGDE